ncbi:hypothetical protein HY448_00335 [Candidatus Pacearchaeota archaeon]|nr:hypothetical protein [Candidatus Pacearchaeota archaeon]
MPKLKLPQPYRHFTFSQDVFGDALFEEFRPFEFASKSEAIRRAVHFTYNILEENNRGLIHSYENPDLSPPAWMYNPFNIHLFISLENQSKTRKGSFNLMKTTQHHLEAIAQKSRITLNQAVNFSLKSLYNGYQAVRAGYQPLLRSAKDPSVVVERIRYVF